MIVPRTTSFELTNNNKSLPINNPPNDPPEKPFIDNPKKVHVNTEYEFHVSSFDPNYDHIYFKINYWDGTITYWIDPFAYNQNVRFTHVYTEEGPYQLNVKAKDDPNMDGDISDGLESPQADSYVQVPIVKTRYDMFLSKIFQMLPSNASNFKTIILK